MRSLERLLAPQSIAMVGGAAAARAIEQSVALGFTGEIWPVHPTRAEIAGRSAYPSIAALPEAPDAAFVAINRSAAIDAVHQLAALGCGGAVVHASGFAETGPEGRNLQDRLVEGHDMPLIGPNCYGSINAVSGAVLWPDVHGCRAVERGPAFVSQSGNIALNMTMNNRGVHFARVLSLGNEASVGLEEIVAHLAADPLTTAIGMYVESINDGLAFGRAALLARQHDTPLVAIRTGRSETASAIAATHTAAVSAASDVLDALFDRYGVLVVDSLPELLTTLGMLQTVGPLSGNRLVSLSCSGGEASIVADRAAAHDVTFEPFETEHASRIKGTLSELVSVTNPLDYHTFIWGDRDALERCFTAVLDGPVDAGMLVLDWPDSSIDDGDWWPTLRAIEAASIASETPTVVVSSLPENMPVLVQKHLAERGLGWATTIDEALAGLGACARLGVIAAKPAPPLHMAAPTAAEQVETVGEIPAKALLAAHGIPVPDGVVLEPGDDDPNHLAYPVVAKTVGVEHKTDVDGVALSIADADGLAAARKRLHAISGSVLVEEMIPDVTAELLVSVRGEHPVGVVATVGVGGTLVELIDDTTTILLPASADDVRAALSATAAGSLLVGARGRQPADFDRVVGVIDALCALMASNQDVLGVEVNPLLATPCSAVAADALVVRAVGPGGQP